MSKSSYVSRVPHQVLRAHVILGALQITVGCLVILLKIISMAAGSRMCNGETFSGIWTGPFFIIAGVSGVVAGKGVKSCTQGCLITCLVFSILTSCLGLIALIIESWFAAANASTQGQETRPADPRKYDLKRDEYSHIKPAAQTQQSNYGQSAQLPASRPGSQQVNSYYAISVICCLLFALELVLATVQAAFACRASCCCCVQKPAPAPQLPEQPLDLGSFIVVDQYGRPVDPRTYQLVSDTPVIVSQPPFNPEFVGPSSQPPPYDLPCARAEVNSEFCATKTGIQ